MTTATIEKGVVHDVPGDLKKALLAHGLSARWNSLTPLARNEWICWVTIVKQDETRKQHITRLCAEIAEGKKKTLLLARLPAS